MKLIASFTFLLLAPLMTPLATAADRPAVTLPRQTSGDRAIHPTWANRLTLAEHY